MAGLEIRVSTIERGIIELIKQQKAINRSVLDLAKAQRKTDEQLRLLIQALKRSPNGRH